MLSASSKTVGPNPIPAPTKSGYGWIEALLIGLLVMIGVDIVFGLVLGAMFSLTRLEPSWFKVVENLVQSFPIVFNFVLYAIARLAGVGIIIYFIKRRGLSIRALGLRRFKFGRGLGLTLLAVMIFFVVVSVSFLALEKLLPGLNLVEEQEVIFTKAKALPEVMLAFIALVVIAPVTEEMIFRGFMLPALSRRFGIVLGVLITSLLFGVVHMQLNVGIMTFFMGLLLGWLVYKTRSLWPAILFHSLKNLVAFILIFGNR